VVQRLSVIFRLLARFDRATSPCRALRPRGPTAHWRRLELTLLSELAR